MKSECAEAADAHAVHTADAARGIEFPSANVNAARFADLHAHAALHALRRIEPQWCERPFREHRKQPADRAERVAEHPPPARRREQDRQQNHARQNRQRQRELRPRLKRLNCLDPPVKLVVHLRKQRLSRSGRIPAEERIRVEQPERKHPAADRKADQNDKHDDPRPAEIGQRPIFHFVERDQLSDPGGDVLKHPERAAERTVEPPDQKRDRHNHHKEQCRNERKLRDHPQQRGQKFSFGGIRRKPVQGREPRDKARQHQQRDENPERFEQTVFPHG